MAPGEGAPRRSPRRRGTLKGTPDGVTSEYGGSSPQQRQGVRSVLRMETLEASTVFRRLRDDLSIHRAREDFGDQLSTTSATCNRRIPLTCAIHQRIHNRINGYLPPCAFLRWIPETTLVATASQQLSLRHCFRPPLNPQESSEVPHQHRNMENFAMDPLIYIPRGGILIDGGGPHRKKRSVVSICGQHVKKNEDMAIANCDDNFTALERHEFLLLIHHHLTQGMKRIFHQTEETHTPLMGRFIQGNLLGYSSGLTTKCYKYHSTTLLCQIKRKRQSTSLESRWLTSRRNRKADDENRKGKAASSSATAIGKAILPERPTLQDFMNVSLDNDDGISNQLAKVNASNAGDASNEPN
ncbi:hypothetical protein GUJ93_ZPchr0010g8172 [Zizania palustris]|uniref:DUF7597 domain-containing protein n=1 Tax=Zizania palustris TaxID=103762 RepID=A0A8J5WG63_ZIZPA|nr:hypothetical protein GUJ93_ZPchr0010g8172 [Zizania palustris]